MNEVMIDNKIINELDNEIDIFYEEEIKNIVPSYHIDGFKNYILTKVLDSHKNMFEKIDFFKKNIEDEKIYLENAKEENNYAALAEARNDVKYAYDQYNNYIIKIKSELIQFIKNMQYKEEFIEYLEIEKNKINEEINDADIQIEEFETSSNEDALRERLGERASYTNKLDDINLMINQLNLTSKRI